MIGVELITRLVSWKIRETCVLFGDAAAGVIVERGPQMAEILGARTGTDGSQWSILTLEIGGTRKPFSLEYAQKEEHLKLIMEGRAVFRHAVHRMSQVGLDVLEAVGAKLEDVAMIVPHQANLRIVQAGSRRTCPCRWRRSTRTSRSTATPARHPFPWRSGKPTARAASRRATSCC